RDDPHRRHASSIANMHPSRLGSASRIFPVSATTPRPGGICSNRATFMRSIPQCIITEHLPQGVLDALVGTGLHEFSDLPDGSLTGAFPDVQSLPVHHHVARGARY